MALTDRQNARKAAQSPEDREMLACLATAKRELDKAKAVCGRVSRGTTEAEQLMAGRARQNRALLEGVLAQLERVTSLKSDLETDIDMLPEEVQTRMSREANLKRRTEKDAKKRQQTTEAAVQTLLHSLGTNK
tara:strand:+ start:27448 stop:27846 length:399 start_codon:yes stop_codon:yes gene_type:complete